MVMKCDIFHNDLHLKGLIKSLPCLSCQESGGSRADQATFSSRRNGSPKHDRSDRSSVSDGTTRANENLCEYVNFAVSFAQ
jgi:hypothetical protein